jgi:FKBP-type peptidyl-prolyl cis-trans isomerase 2
LIDHSDIEEPEKIILGENSIFPGIDFRQYEYLLNLCEGDRRLIVVSPDDAYGEEGNEELEIPPNAPIHYDIEIVKIIKRWRKSYIKKTRVGL